MNKKEKNVFIVISVQNIWDNFVENLHIDIDLVTEDYRKAVKHIIDSGYEDLGDDVYINESDESAMLLFVSNVRGEE